MRATLSSKMPSVVHNEKMTNFFLGDFADYVYMYTTLGIVSAFVYLDF